MRKMGYSIVSTSTLRGVSGASYKICFTVRGTQKVTSVKRLPIVLGLGCGNDPSAGSPTETLLRLHLPLNDEV
jgi:hypothetical protein